MGLVSGPFWAPGGPKRARFGPKCPFWGPRRSSGDPGGPRGNTFGPDCPLSSLYFFLIGEKYFLLFLHLFCLNFFSSKNLLFHLFFSVKKLASTTQYVIVLYTTII